MSSSSPFTFVDLFAGVGGFHAALGALGGRCVYAVEKDPAAAAVYERNWRMPALGDIIDDTDGQMRVPPHDVLAAGFPCQPFSKSGFQRGMDEARGTLLWTSARSSASRSPRSSCSRTCATSLAPGTDTSGKSSSGRSASSATRSRRELSSSHPICFPRRWEGGPRSQIESSSSPPTSG
jgi:hypothetical protein